MDKQITNIPVNTRTVGDAKHISEGIYVLYLEDYVHTFIKKLIYEQEPDIIAGTSVYMYGSSFERESQTIMVVSGAATSEQADKNYFSTGMSLCTALVSLNKDRGIRFEISIRGTKVILDDFYIYYDQNEEMQNYLIEWNNKKHEQQLQSPIKTVNRIPADNAARLGRIAQAYNKESARVSMVWGAMNVLSLSLVVCVIAYGIISLNSYGKMQTMQESIDYCMTFVSENIEKSGEKNEEAVEVINQTQEQITEKYTEAVIEENGEMSTALPAEEAVLQQEITETATETATETVAGEAALQQETTPQQPVQAASASVPQYYVVRRGDTLRSICISVYGDYSRIDEICALNGLDNPDSILYGQKLLLP